MMNAGLRKKNIVIKCENDSVLYIKVSHILLSSDSVIRFTQPLPGTYLIHLGREGQVWARIEPGTFLYAYSESQEP